MNRYPLAPRQLSDSLVGLVRPRAPTGRHQGDGAGLATPFQAAVSPYTSIKIEAPRAPIHDQYRAAGDALLSLTGVEVGGPTAEKPHSTSRTEMKLSPDKLKETHKRKRVDAGKSRRREQCRANQARYRDKQRNAQLQLEKSVELLHAELDTLKRRYRDLSSRERSNQSPWSIVAEVFRLLESSFRFPWRTANAQEMSHHQNTRQILAVLERSFAHDAAMGELSGANALMKQVRCYSQCFGDPVLKLQRIESVAPSVMTARAKLSMTITEFTLRHAFPHLEKPICGRNGEDGRGLLYERMLGKRLDFNFSLNFLFDEDSDRVVRLETSIDLTTPLLRLLGNLRDVANVLVHAQISSECIIGDQATVGDGCSSDSTTTE
ncbi:bZIP transcription factor 1 [Phytophthora ramorum]|uniref:bZIP transcription factor 1 n=1 Tax=Phytophthora ramorum TaxID=164328 RepID=UPI0030A984D8|nr:bZIP transcription factor 1 [Phytophthora ramorum]